jgi:hypothetical protein
MQMGRCGRALAVLAIGFLTTGLACGLAVAGETAQAQQFSADLVAGGAAGAMSRIEAKLYVADRKVRIETPELPGSFFLVDEVIPAAYLVRPAQRMFIDAMQSSRLTRLFVPLDPADPCPQWQAMAEVAGITDGGRWRCDAQGRDTVDERDAVRFGVTSARGRSTGWIDPQLKFPLQIETEDGALLALRNVQEAPQPADKFEIPAYFKKLDPRGVIELLKHTDIWVEPPH